jgi:hypothetical protein
MPLGDVGGWGWKLLADHECFYTNGRRASGETLTTEVFIPGLGCSLWVAEQ